MKKLFLFCMFSLILLALFSKQTFSWPVPDTGQTKCYDTGDEISPCPKPGEPYYGQDANYRTYPMSYTKLDSNGNRLLDSASEWVAVQDNVTGLIWEVKHNKDGNQNFNNPNDADNHYTWYNRNSQENAGEPGTPGDGTDTEDFINALNAQKYGGYSDWRLPTPVELFSLINISSFRQGVCINTSYFPNTNFDTNALWTNSEHMISEEYWASFSNIHYSSNAWYVDFYQAVMKHNASKHYSRSVRAVRGEQFGGNDAFIVNGDGTVTDPRTGLTWQQTEKHIAHIDNLFGYVESLELGGYNDWRVPTIKELSTIISFDRYDPAINESFFPYSNYMKFYSSTFYPYVSNKNGIVYSLDGSAQADFGYLDIYIHAVRGGQATRVSNAEIAQTPTTAPATAKYTQWGNGFTPNSTATLHFYTHPEHEFITTQAVQIGSDGTFSRTFNPPATENREYLWYAIDDATDFRSSNHVTYIITEGPVPNIMMGPLTGPQGTTFELGGNGFTPHEKATIIVKDPLGNEILNKETDINSDGGIQYHLEIAEEAPTGEYVWWAVDNATDFKAVEMRFTVTYKGTGPTPATPVAPGNHEQISGNAYTFEWTHPYNDEYEVTIKDEGGNTVLTSVRTTEKSVLMDLPGLKSGSWYKWTITVYADGLSQISAENFFTYLGSASDITPPTLDLPANEAKIVTSYDQDKHLFSWTHPFDDEYQVVIVNDQEQEFHRSEMTTEKSIEVPTYNDLGKGVGETYYWYVVVKTDNNTDASDRFSFQYYKDTDSDGLLDDWEINGYDANGDNEIDIDLPQMGADQFKKDIFVEIDYMLNFVSSDNKLTTIEYRPSLDAVERVVEAFANAPVPNIGSSNGIQLHIDAGPEYTDRYNRNFQNQWGDLSESNPVVYRENLTSAFEDEEIWTEFDKYKRLHFLPNNREKIFRYCLYIDNQMPDNPATPDRVEGRSSGRSREIPGSDFIVSLGAPWNSERQKNDNQNTATIMHELGHSLGLNHWGLNNEDFQGEIKELRNQLTDDEWVEYSYRNWKPNFLSIMNYSFQMDGLIIEDSEGNVRNGFYDYSRFYINELNENDLDETRGLGMVNAQGINGWSSTKYCTVFVDPQRNGDPHTRLILEGDDNDPSTPPEPLYVNNPINWDNYIDANGTGIVADINGDGITDVLRATVNEWENLVYSAGSVGGELAPIGNSEGAARSQISHPEITYEQYSQMPHPYGVSLSQDIDSLIMDIGAIDQHSIWVKNTGDNADSFELNYTDALGYFDTDAIPSEVSLDPGETQKIDIDVIVPTDAYYGDAGALNIQATSQGNPNFSDSLRFLAKILRNGDVNGDGLIHIGDVVQLKSNLFGIAGITGHPDANSDGKIDEFDVDAVIDEIFATEVPSSENTQTIRAGISVVAPDDPVPSQFPISVALDDPVQQTTAAQFDVVFEDSLVETLSINKAELSSDYDFKYDLYEPGRLRVLIYPSVPEADFYDISGKMANLDMEITNGQGPIEIRLENVFLSEIHGKSYKPDVITNATIDVDGAPGSETLKAEAGSSQTVDSGATATLNGSGSTTGAGITYQWTQTAGPSVTLTDANSIQASFTAPDIASGSEILTFRLTVSDADGNTTTDTSTVTVSDQAAGKEPDDDHDGPGDTNNCFINSVFH